MGPYNGPSHAYEGSVEYPSAEGIRSRTSSHSVFPHTTRSRIDGSGMALSQERRRVTERSVRYASYRSDSYVSGSQCVGLQAHPTTNSIREPTLQPHPTLQDLQTTPMTRVESSSSTSPEPPYPRDNRRRRDLFRARSDNLVIEAVERATAPRRISLTSFRRPWQRRELSGLLSRYDNITFGTDCLLRLSIRYVSHELGATLEDNMQNLLTRVPRRYVSDVVEMILADFRGTSNEVSVRRMLTSFNGLPPENEDTDPVPPYEELWEEHYDTRFGWAIVPAYQT